MSRVKSERAEFAVSTSGVLKDELRKHAYERCRHFFLYMFFYKALIDWLNAKHGFGLSAKGLLKIHASHQADTGFRSSDTQHSEFDATDATIVDKVCTAFHRMDATHFCNLGIDPAYGIKISNFGSQDKMVFTLYESLACVCMNTRLLPQRVNIGPDKIIDALHGALATKILETGKPPVTASNMEIYFDSAKKALGTYKIEQQFGGKNGTAACVDAYLECYNKDGEELWKSISNNVVSECFALGLTEADYFSQA
jgi:hypothetical protein